MLDQQSKSVYDVLKKLTGEDDIYKIIEADEILDLLSADMTKVQLSAIIRDLRDREYIKVKYFTPDEYCLLTLKRAEELASLVEEVAAANAPEKKTESKSAPEKVTVAVRKSAVFWAAFFGSLLGGAVIAAIAIVLQKFLF